MKIQVYILIVLLMSGVFISLGGCNTSESTFVTQPVSSEDYNEEEVFLEAERLGLRPVDYLHYANNPDAVQPSFKIFGVHLISEGTAYEQLNALDEFQDRPCRRCSRGGFGWRGHKGRLRCLPFIGANEAGRHQERLEKIVEIQSVIVGASTQ